MEFTVNVNLNASTELLDTVNRLADAFGGVKTSSKNAMREVKVVIAEEVKESIIEEQPKSTRSRATKPKVEEVKPPVEVAKEEAVETVAEEAVETVENKGDGTFVPSVEKLRELAVPMARDGFPVKTKLTELGFGGITQISETGTPEQVIKFYNWLLETKKTTK